MDKDEYNNDDTQLAQMGHKSELKRNFSLMYVQLKISSSWIYANCCFSVPCWVLLLLF